jgi:colanic acid/amylovoran biosynthesis glycosyltransferase
MKIAFITESFPERSETFILGKVAALTRRGHQVTVFTQFKRDANVHPDLLAGLDCKRQVVRLPAWDRVRGKDVVRSLVAAGAWRGGRPAQRPGSLLAWVKTMPFMRERFDLIHAHYAYMGARWLTVMDTVGAPLVVSILGHDLTYHGERHRKEYGELFRRGPRFLASSQLLARLAESEGIDPARITVLYPEVDTDFFAPVERGGRTGPLALLTVGRLDWTKGLIYALEAMSLLVERGLDFQYRIVGEGSARTEIETAIRDLGLAERVILTGAKDRAGCRDELGRADVFVLASVSEAFGLAAAEAQATGLPVVATRIGGLPEAVVDNQTGLLVPSRDPGALANAIQQLADRPDLRLALGRRGRERVVAEFDRGLLTDRLIATYNEVVAQWKARA